MAFMISGTGRRTALAFDGGLGSPTLVLKFHTPSTPVTPPPTPPAPAPQVVAKPAFTG
jgi:hypothetical protein